MNVRLAACDPCRRAKLACGHEQPTCTRCRDRGQSNACVYRARPFRKKNPGNRTRRREESPRTQETQATSPLDASPRVEASSAATQPHRYPNPGFLGMSSHSTIFNQVFPCAATAVAPHDDHVAQSPIPPSPVDALNDWAVSDRAAHALSRFPRMEVSKLMSLVQSWLDKDVNLPLAEPFVAPCSEAVAKWSGFSTSANTPYTNLENLHRVRILLENTHKPIVVRRDTDITDLLSQILGTNMRWESLGIFFTAAARAALDTTSFPPLYTSDEQRRGLIKALTYVGDCCLETCIALDCLNDLQLILQYENFIVHSQVDGDQSYHSWRRMGDVASSLFALGYHEKVDESVANVPPFITELRKACFARIYAADKSLAVFLGRPPRIVKEYCYFQLPTNLLATREDNDATASGNVTPLSIQRVDHEADYRGPNGPETINYTADTRCTARFASLKEEVLQLFRKSHPPQGTLDTCELRLRVEKQWQELPPHFRLTTSLKDCHRRPFERDFLAGTRLDYLHILFLLGLVSQRRMSEPGDALLTVASEMLSLTVDVIILRDRLVNSGTSLIWKVAQYGLPAAGIISLALLNSIRTDARPFSRSKMVQDLSVLVAEITIGAWIQAGEPNFALFTRATRTIQSLLDSLAAWKPHAGSSDSHHNLNSGLAEDWDPYINSQSWEFEMDFWTSLAEHPTLLS